MKSLKPLLLTFNDHFSLTNETNPPYFYNKLKEKYDYLYVPLGQTKSPFEFVDEVINFIHLKKLNPEAVISLYDTESIVASLLVEKLGLPGPKPISIFRAQHKAVFSEIASEINSNQPQTFLINLRKLVIPSISYPAFLRTVKGGGSRFAYIVHSENELIERLELLKQERRPDLDWYDLFFNSYPCPSPKAKDLYLLQPFIEAKQYTADGFVYRGEATVIDYTGTIYSDDRKSFVRFDFPAQLDDKIKNKLSDLTQRLCEKLEYDNAGFNLEFFVTQTGELVLIEFNTRISTQFVPLFDQKYTDSTIDMICQLALGKEPKLQAKPHVRYASSFPLRAWKNYKVLSVPSKDKLDTLMQENGVLSIKVFAEAGKDLKHLKNDAYSYRYGIVDIAGDNLQEILARFNSLQKRLGIVY